MSILVQLSLCCLIANEPQQLQCHPTVQLDQAIPGQELDQWPHCDFAGEFITGSSIGQWEPW